MYDVIVIGGGPAGMMAAGRAAERGARVLLLEKNPSLGKKLLITGGGRCNVTNAEANTRTLLSHFKDSDKFLFSPFSQWNSIDTIRFFNERNMPTKIEDNLRVFPTSDKAQSVWSVLVQYLKEGAVTVKSGEEVKRMEARGTEITGVTLKSGEILTAQSYILATGGKSRPETGSTGDGFGWLSTLGHTVKEPDASLVPLTLKDTWTKLLSGLTLPEVKISVFQNGKRFNSKKGKLLFTHVGVSGPTILNMSKGIGELLPYGEVTLEIDLFPAYDNGTLDQTLIALFETHSNKHFKNILCELLPTALANALIAHTAINPNTPCHSISKEARKACGLLLKHVPLRVKGLLGVDKAIVTSGGVSLDEINTRTMCSRQFNNLYIVGDLLNIDRPSGGYSLQLCWTTGFVAGSSVALDS
ncbi:NAD(P)/FAD-dependent oxidoreductase [Patescibacteria group bacterium]|nr:NAD(P)/FAD-dependent oxidoreductase [Patescibacteria group bacterium]